MSSSSTPVCDVVVVDSAGFLRNVALNGVGNEIVTLNEVVGEIKDKATKQRLQVLPYELKFKQADTDYIQRINEFSKKTGDFSSLSATDIKVLAVTLQMEEERMGSGAHLRKEPLVKPTVNFHKGAKKVEGETEEERKKKQIQGDLGMAGFYLPEGEEEDDEEEEENELGEKETKPGEVIPTLKDLTVSEDANAPTKQEPDQADSAGQSPTSDDQDEEEENYGEEEFSEDYLDGDNEEEEEEEDDDDDWITPGNIKEKQKMMNGIKPEDEIKHVKVACLTTDFAMQNVLKQMGLNVVSAGGHLISETRTWILRCYACFRTTSVMTSQFCPKCGNKTLKRVAVTINADGTQEIHINARRPLSKRGKKFSLPAPKGGKYAVNPVLAADMGLGMQKVSRMARMKTDALSEDYIAGNSPFALRDVTSKSAALGVSAGDKGKVGGFYWQKKNPNEGTKKTGNRKKKRV